MEIETIKKIKQKKEFSGLPDSIVGKVAEMLGGDIKKSRAFLRKYFGVFLTNKILKPKNYDEVLKTHLSSKQRDYEKFYYNIFSGEKFQSIIDIGAGVNGFSFPQVSEITGARQYFGIEASRQLVDLMNEFFAENKFDARAIWRDIFEIEEVIKIIKNAKKPTAIFMFQIIDALEAIEKNYSKKIISEILKEFSDEDILVISLSMKSLGGKSTLNVKRKWLVDFLTENSKIEKDYIEGNERLIVVKR